MTRLIFKEKPPIIRNYPMAAVALDLIEILRAVAAALPDTDYPPANVAKMIKECENAGRSDLGQQIMMQWNKVVNKYPQTRINWGRLPR